MTNLQQGEIQVTFPSQTEYVHMVTTIAGNAAAIAGFDEKIAGKVLIATDEAVTNVIRHAYGGDPDREITMAISITPESLIIRLFHNGNALREEDIKLPDMDKYIQEKKPGGLGLFIINKFMDEVDYLTGEPHCCQMKKYRKEVKAGGEK